MTGRGGVRDFFLVACLQWAVRQMPRFRVALEGDIYGAKRF